MTDTPKTPSSEPEQIIELVDVVTNNPWLIVAAFIIGAAIVAGVVFYLGRDKDE